MKKKVRIILIVVFAAACLCGLVIWQIFRYVEESQPRSTDRLTDTQRAYLAKEFFIPTEAFHIQSAGYAPGETYYIRAEDYAGADDVLALFSFKSEKVLEDTKAEINNSAFWSEYESLAVTFPKAYRIYSLNSFDTDEPFDVYIMEEDGKWSFVLEKDMLSDNAPFLEIFAE